MSLKPFKITPHIQPYAWGGTTYISRFLGIANEHNQPMAEAWFGDHIGGPSIILPSHQKLNEYIHAHTEKALGLESIELYGSQMPFLLKILDVHDMLSIQLHPNIEEARIGYELENKAGIPIKDPKRNYKDANHKPEILFCLSDFWLLQGFATLEKIKARFEALVPSYKWKNEYTWQSLMYEIWNTTGEDYVCYVNEINNRLSTQDTQNKNEIFHWLVKAIKMYPANLSGIDRGLLQMLMMHVQYLKPGEVGYQAPGVVHAYLEGQNIELMANSDNVLRGGLTPKHIDPKELLRLVDFTQAGQSILTPIYIMEDEATYNPPVNDFMIKHFNVKEGVSKAIQFNTIGILLVKSGELLIDDVKLRAGQSICIPAYTAVDVLSITKAEYFLAVGTV